MDYIRLGNSGLKVSRRCLGASSMFAWQFMRMLATADAHGWTRFVSMQNHEAGEMTFLEAPYQPHPILGHA